MPTAPPPGASETRDESLTQTVDALPRLSPRSLKDSVDAADAGPGRYLTVDDGVSRRHALLAVRAHGARILDDRSANGTHVNGRRVSEAELTDGDVIVLGRVVLSYDEIA